MFSLRYPFNIKVEMYSKWWGLESGKIGKSAACGWHLKPHTG